MFSKKLIKDDDQGTITIPAQLKPFLMGKSQLSAKANVSSHFYSGVFATSFKESGSMGVFRGKGSLRRKDWPGFDEWEISSEFMEDNFNDTVPIDLDAIDSS